LEQSDSPLTHAEVADKIQELGVDKATVLRNLVDLVAAGLARRTELGDRLWRYESADPAQPLEAHPHFLCVDCGSVTCLGDLELTPSSRRQSEVVGRVTEILLKGHCQNCNEVQPVRG
jgi:Fur family ferric uptake transcriptional regulator